MRRQSGWVWSGRCRGARVRGLAASTGDRLPTRARRDQALPLLLKERVDVILWRERNQVIDPFADADVPDRQLEVVSDRHRDAALGRAIELGQHDSRHPGDAGEFPRLRQPVLPHRGVEHEQHLVRRAVSGASGDAPDLIELAHQVGAGVQAPGRVDQDRIAAPGLARLNRVEHDGGGIRAFLRADDVDVRPLGPDRKLLDGGGAERVGRTHQRLLPRRLQQIGEFADGRGLASAVDADDQRDVRSMTVERWRPIDRIEDVADLGLDQFAEALATAGPAAHGGDDLLGGGNAYVRREQQFFERLNRVDVNFPGFRTARVFPLNDFVEAIDNLLLGAGETLAEPVKKSQIQTPKSQTTSYRLPATSSQLPADSYPASARWGRSIRSYSAVRASLRPASSSATWAVIGSSTPWRAPSASAAPVVRTPSATIFIPDSTSSSDRPRASSIPTCRLRLSAPVQVRTRSPRPVSPASVSR